MSNVCRVYNIPLKTYSIIRVAGLSDWTRSCNGLHCALHRLMNGLVFDENPLWAVKMEARILVPRGNRWSVELQ